MLAMKALGTINHSTLPDTRITLYWGDDGYVWAAAPGEDVYKTDVKVGGEVSAWGGDEWDLELAPEDD